MKIPKSLLALGLCLAAYSCAHEAPTTSKEQNQTHAPATIDEQAHTYTQLIRDLIQKPIDQDKHTQGFRSQESSSNSRLSSLSPKDKRLLQEISDLSLDFYPEGDNSGNALPSEVSDSLISLCEISLDPNHERYPQAVRNYEQSKVYKSYSPAIQAKIQLRLSMIGYMREDIVELYHKNLHGRSTFRMSPGDRMIWSEVARQMNPCQLELAMILQLTGIGIAAGSYSGAGMAVDLMQDFALDLVRQYMDCNKDKRQELKHLKNKILLDGPHQGGPRPKPGTPPQPRNGRPELPPHLERKKYENNPGPPPPPGKPVKPEKPEKPENPGPPPPPGKPGKPVRPS